MKITNHFGKKLHLRFSNDFRVRLWSNLCTDILFIISRISERPDIQGYWFNASIKVIQRLCMMLADGPHIKLNF